MPVPTEQLPPDAEQKELADEVNKRLGGDKRINFYRVQNPEGGLSYGAVFSYGSARHFVQQDAAWFDPDELVAAVTRWVERL